MSLQIDTRTNDATSLASRAIVVLGCVLLALCTSHAYGQSTQLVLDHDGSTIVLEPYAPNIVRVTLSLQKDQALALPGFGFIAHPESEGWAHQQTAAADI